MRILNLQQVEVLLPIWPFFLKRRRTITNLNPLNGSVIALSSLFHVPKVFAAGDRPPAERSFINGSVESFPPAGFHFGGNQVSHEEIVLRGNV
jgi:hypothetical protein